MIIEILMPALSPTMTEGNLAKWYKKEGDKVKAGEIIAEIETDKATMEVEAVDEGVIGKLLVDAGTQSVKVGSAIALILEEESDQNLLAEYKIKTLTIKNEEKLVLEEKKEIIISGDSKVEKSGRVFASPLAKRIADQNSINISQIDGSGPHGRIVKSDVEKAMSKVERKIISIGGYDLEPVSNMRKVIAKRLLESKLTVPHFYLNIDCNLDNLLEIREQINSDLEKDQRISINDFIIKASAMAMEKNPDVNSSWSDQGIIRYRDIDISVAVAIDGGLVTPIIKSANYKTIFEISKEMKQLAKKAKEGKLMPEEYQGGSFSISNLGMFGIKQFAAIINPPQSCILAVGGGNKVPVVKDDKIWISTISEMTLSCDHRIVDGAVGAKFLASFKNYIEKPAKLLM